jgi:hypothetical protein
VYMDEASSAVEEAARIFVPVDAGPSAQR